jgi:hypothetical protein
MKNKTLLFALLINAAASTIGPAATMDSEQSATLAAYSTAEFTAPLQGQSVFPTSVGSVGQGDDTTRQWISQPTVLPTIFVVGESEYL